MGAAKEIVVKVIPPKIANDFVRKSHYSGKVVPNSNLHFGVFYHGELHGVMQYGPSTDKSKLIGLVDGTKWNEFIELNRMAFDDVLPRNSESRAISLSIKLIKRNAPHIKWIVSFADGCQCGDGTIYRAANFVLTGIKKNNSLRIDDKGNVFAKMTYYHKPNKIGEWENMKVLDGYQLRYIYFIDRSCRQKLTVPEIPFSRIDEIGAGMYKGKKITMSERHIDKKSN